MARAICSTAEIWTGHLRDHNAREKKRKKCLLREESVKIQMALLRKKKNSQSNTYPQHRSKRSGSTRLIFQGHSKKSCSLYSSMVVLRSTWGYQTGTTSHSMPIGLHGATATFQCLMDQILQGTDAYAAAYIDHVVIYSQTWEEHLAHLTDIFRKIKHLGLTINPKVCYREWSHHSKKVHWTEPCKKATRPESVFVSGTGGADIEVRF